MPQMARWTWAVVKTRLSQPILVSLLLGHFGGLLGHPHFFSFLFSFFPSVNSWTKPQCSRMFYDILSLSPHMYPSCSIPFYTCPEEQTSSLYIHMAYLM
jgi:hypothetical protein